MATYRDIEVTGTRASVVAVESYRGVRATVTVLLEPDCGWPMPEGGVPALEVCRYFATDAANAAARAATRGQSVCGRPE